MPTVRTNDVETYYEHRGNGPPIVFVHGAILDHAQWEPQIDRLSDEHTTIAYDVRGHGRTGGSERESYSIDLFADDLDALLAALDVERPVLCGLSMGGCIAQVYAATHPERIAGLVLAGTFTPDLSTWDERIQMTVLRAVVPLVRLVGYERVQRAMAWIHERFNRGASGDYEAVERIQAEAPKMETNEFAKMVGSLTDFPETTIDVSAIAVPTLVLYGENEPGFVRRQARKLGTEIPNASVQEVPDAGHASNLDDPDFFTDAVRAVLTQVHPSGSEAVSGEDDLGLERENR